MCSLPLCNSSNSDTWQLMLTQYVCAYMDNVITYCICFHELFVQGVNIQLCRQMTDSKGFRMFETSKVIWCVVQRVVRLKAKVFISNLNGHSPLLAASHLLANLSPKILSLAFLWSLDAVIHTNLVKGKHFKKTRRSLLEGIHRVKPSFKNKKKKELEHFKPCLLSHLQTHKKCICADNSDNLKLIYQQQDSRLLNSKHSSTVFTQIENHTNRSI